jgi:hypothetical protein
MLLPVAGDEVGAARDVVTYVNVLSSTIVAIVNVPLYPEGVAPET